MSYCDQKVFITGATGFVGGRLAERLIIEQRAQVHALVRKWSKAVWIGRLPVDLFQGNLGDSAAIGRAIAGCRFVFHCASGGNSESEYLQTNVDGTRNLLDAAVKEGVKRFVYISSIAVHGPLPPDNADETDELRSCGRPYSQSKILAEQLVLKYSREHALPVTIVRPTFIWGPRSHLFTVKQLKSMKAGTFRLIDNGQGQCHAIYIDNLVDLLITAGLHPNAMNEVFFATDGYCGLTWKAFFDYYADWIGVKKMRSISAASLSVRLQSQLVERLGRMSVRLQGSPAPLWRRGCRRMILIAVKNLEGRGIPNSWDLAKFARRGRLNASKAMLLLGHQSRWSLAEAMRETEFWVRDQLGLELGLEDQIEQSKSECRDVRSTAVLH